MAAQPELGILSGGGYWIYTDRTVDLDALGQDMKWLVSLALCWTLWVDKPLAVIDGDTFDVMAIIWINQTIKERVRVLNIDTPEMRQEPDRARAAKDFTIAWLEQGPFQIGVCTRDSFGRILATVYRGDEFLAAELKKAGHIKTDSKYNQ